MWDTKQANISAEVKPAHRNVEYFSCDVNDVGENQRKRSFSTTAERAYVHLSYNKGSLEGQFHPVLTTSKWTALLFLWGL